MDGQENNQSYTANPNQKVYDMPHFVDHEISVLNVFFAQQEKVYKEEPKTEDVKASKNTTVKEILKPFKKDKEKLNITSTPSGYKTVVKKGETVTVNWKEKVHEKDEKGELKYDYPKINNLKVGKKLFIVADCLGEKGKLTIEILENKLTNAEVVYDNPVKFLIGEDEKTKIEFTISKEKTRYLQEITLRPKTDEDLKKLVEKFNTRTDKKAFLYLKGDITETQDDIKFPDETHEFCNKDNVRLEIKYCDCGIKYKNDITCTRYNKVNFGPLYSGDSTLKDYSKWDDLIKENSLTEDEKSILVAMSENEGNFDAVQSYDSEILTAGAMQKTINPEGYGELPIQLWEFKEAFPDKFSCYLENCGWEIEREETDKEDENGNVISTTYKFKAKYKSLTGNALKNKIREGFDSSKFGKKVICEPIQPIINLMKDSDFQAKQIKDFIKRLHDSLNKKPTGYTYVISDFISSNLGKATVLDHDVNRPGHVKDCFGTALDSFFKKNPKLSKNPSDWKESSKYETEILEIYGPLRGEGDYTMTNAKTRYTNLKSKL